MSDTGSSSFLHGHGTERDRRLQRRITAWGLVWAATFTGICFAIWNGWIATSPPLVVGSAVVSVIPGIGLLVVYRRFLRDADELRRKIELDALALAVGVGLVGGFAFWILEVGEVVDDAFPYLVMMIAGTYLLGLIVGYRRFR